MKNVQLYAVLFLFTTACSSDSGSVKSVKYPPALRQLSLHNNTIRLEIPANWTRQRKLRVWGPDCASCSGREYAYVVGKTDNSSFVSVDVKVYPASDNRFYSATREWSILSEKDPRAALIDTLTNDKAQTRTVFLKSWRGKKAICSGIKVFVSRCRTISVHVQTPETVENIALIKQMIESAIIDEAYLAAPYKRAN